MSSDGKIKSGKDAKRLTRIRSAAPWRLSSLPSEIEKIKAAEAQREKKECFSYDPDDFREPGYASPKHSRDDDTSYFQFQMSPQLRRRLDGRARELKISSGELVRRLVEKECEE